VAAHLTGIHSAIKMLNSRIRVLYQHIVAMQKGIFLLKSPLSVPLQFVNQAFVTCPLILEYFYVFSYGEERIKRVLEDDFEQE